MAIATVPLSMRNSRAAFVEDLVQTWVAGCNNFLQWQRNEIIERRPSPQTLTEHRETLKLMLRLGKSFHAQVSDPDFPLPQASIEVAGKLRQLEKSWEMIHNPMTDADADDILLKAFPDESRTGTPA
jgi:hypothetical protein